MRDVDGDGYGDTVAPTDGFIGSDCDDADPTIYPTAEDIHWDGIDQDCDKNDNYGFASLVAGYDSICGVTDRQTVECWGERDYDELFFGMDPAAMSEIEIGDQYSCFISSGLGNMLGSDQ